ncbi:unnamed protein product [Ostreobium quekettii]|uniref:HU family DNA-binding protein n=1 Tax=Ostreobium quekettii TaxID=121088 RepID=A0A8S1J3C9_9CHLO|nr:unnamed protein product [Ostreobium quekettii]|eukprot:evm.model.scf_183.6 EVM.evm.TU.scf_183.6   scf_183:27920-28700(-)
MASPPVSLASSRQSPPSPGSITGSRHPPWLVSSGRKRRIGPVAAGIGDVSERLSKALMTKEPYVLLPKEESMLVVKTVFEVIGDVMTEGDRLVLPGFGSFESVPRKPRKARNLQTGEEFVTEAKMAPKFKASKQLKDRVHDALKSRLHTQ